MEGEKLYSKKLGIDNFLQRSVLKPDFLFFLPMFESMDFLKSSLINNSPTYKQNVNNVKLWRTLKCLNKI